MGEHGQRRGHIGLAEDLAAQASWLNLAEMIALRARREPDALALTEGPRKVTLGMLNRRVNRTAHALAALGVRRGDRVGILAENRVEYVELTLACGKLGAILCAMNWRLMPGELQHCVTLVEPRVMVASPRFEALLGGVSHGASHALILGPAYEALLERAAETEPQVIVQPEDGWVILYTSGTTGLPKGALISHRAEQARMMVNVLDMGLRAGLGLTAWPPMYHMASMEQTLHVLAVGGTVHLMDGPDLERLTHLAATENLWWLVLLPGMVGAAIDAFKAAKTPPRRPEQCGAMADLVPAHQIAEVSRILDAPYVNTFGSTETGMPPLSGHRIPPGRVPERLSKRPNSLSTFRLVDADDNDVPDGTAGEMAFRGPTCFSGYWNAPETNERDFRGGWVHLGDMFKRCEDGSYDFVDRVKYMIKSGGENIYPAEIERVLLRDARVTEAVVVRRSDDQWGEVPVAFVARTDDTLTPDALDAQCRAELASYKRPKDYRFIPHADFPRSTTGKVQRHELEKLLGR